MCGSCRMKKKSKYKPKPIILNPMQFVQESFQTMGEHSGSMMLTWKLRVNESFSALLKGEANKRDFDNLHAAINIVESLLVICKGKDVDGSIPRATCAILEIGSRYRKGQRALKAPEIQAMRDLVSFHDELVVLVTVRQFEDALNFARKEIKAGRCLTDVDEI